MNKTSLQMIADIRTDLKDSGSLWSAAELNRCIERSVADLSRYLPEERMHEITLSFSVEDESVTFPADTDADRIVDGADISSTDDGDTLTIAAQPDVPRPLTMTITDASGNITNLIVIIKGTDKDGKAIQEALNYAKGMGVITGKEYFKTVNEVEVDQIDGNTSGESLDIGIGAYTDVWVYLTYRPVKDASETGTDAASNSLTRGTDYKIDYGLGRVKAISGGDISAGEACTFDYTKIQIGVDISDIPRLVRVRRVEYPVGQVPQSFPTFDVDGKYVFLTGSDAESQSNMRESEHVRIYYDAQHIPPSNYAPGTIPDFLEGTLMSASEAYALLIYALKQEHQAETDLASLRTALTAAGTAHTALGVALTNVKKYLDNNSAADAAGILQDITDDIASLRTAISTALDAANAYLDSAASDITNADAIDLDAQGDAAGAYLETGDDLINTITVGGENERTPEMYAEYARAWAEGVGSLYIQQRSGYLDNATRRTNAALAYVQEAAQRLRNLSTYIEQSSGYSTIASLFAREAEARLTEINSYIATATAYAQSAAGGLALADKYRGEALQLRNEVLSIWGDRKQLIGDYTMGSVKQIPMDNR